MIDKALATGIALVLAQTVLAGPGVQRGDDIEEALAIAVDAAALTDSRVQLTADQHRALEGVTKSLRRGRVERAGEQWETFVGGLAIQDAPIDINALIQWVLRESYLQTTDDLRFFAEKVRYFNSQKKAVREALQNAGSFREVLDERGEATEEIDIRIENLERKLAEVGEDSQLANLDLQNVLQKQQQTLQTISNVSKMLYDTATSTIRKVGS